MNEMELKKFAAQIRIDLIKMLKHRRYGHIGGALSIVETLAVLYGDEMKYDPKNPNWEDRDYFVLSNTRYHYEYDLSDSANVATAFNNQVSMEVFEEYNSSWKTTNGYAYGNFYKSDWIRIE